MSALARFADSSRTFPELREADRLTALEAASRRTYVSLTSERRLASLADDDRSESRPDHGLGTIHHLVNDVGDAHESLGLTNRFTR
jgi:hypothetical protein